MKKFVAILLALALALGVSACGQGTTQQSGQSESNSPSTSEKAPAESEKASPEAIDIWAPCKDTVTITTVQEENASITFEEGGDYYSNKWTKFWKDRLNVQVDTMWVSNEYKTKLNLAMAEENLPDVFSVDSTMLKQLVEADMVMDMTELYEQYASPLIKGYSEYGNDIFETGKVDGHLYGLAQYDYGYIVAPNYAWIRKDWKEGNGLKDPKSFEELVKVAKTFMEKNSAKYGITEDKTLFSLKMLAPAWNAYPGLWVEGKDGKITFGSIQPEMKDALAAFNKLYKEGILNPEFTSYDMSKSNQDVINGLVGIQPFYQWWGWNPGTNVVTKNGPESYFQAYEIPTATGNPVKSPLRFTNFGYIVISKTCKNPEAAMKVINLTAEARVKESKYYAGDELADTLFAGSYHNLNNNFKVIDLQQDYNQFCKVQETLKGGNDSNLSSDESFKYKQIVKWNKEKDPTAMGEYLQQGDEKCAYSVAKKILDEKRYIKDKLWGAPTPMLVELGSTLDDTLMEGFTKIIAGEKPIEYFDTLVQQWKDIGGDAVTTEMNEYYNK